MHEALAFIEENLRQYGSQDLVEGGKFRDILLDLRQMLKSHDELQSIVEDTLREEINV